MRNADATPRNTWAPFVKAAREDTGMTPTEAIAKLGIDRTTLWRWETGRATPGESTVVAHVATVYGIDVDEALAAAGLKPDVTPPTEPSHAPPLDPDMRVVMRILADPKTNEATRTYILRTLHILATLPDTESGRQAR